jgi:hypothetical protein
LTLSDDKLGFDPLTGTPKLFCDVFEWLERESVRYVVVGGVAVVLHGHERQVADLDIVVASESEELRRASVTLAKAGFVSSLPLPLNMLTVARLFDAHAREIDVFVRYRIPFAELWSDSWMAKVGEEKVRVMSLKHLLQVKRLDARPNDLEDLEALLAHRQ